ncbi:hypothetical protein IJC60_00855 [bacterium]|nr:hypothetical protein [bacterium]
MSKSKKSTTVATTSINGVPKLTTVTDKHGNQTTKYNMSEWEKLAYDYAEKEFAKNLKNINVFSEDTLKALNNQINAYKESGIKKIDEIYSPMLKNLQNDIAQRFGNLDNSIFLDKLSEIEDKRAESVSALSQDIVAKENELIGDELAKRYNYLNFLNGYQNQVLSTALGSSASSSKIAQNITTTNNSSNNLTEHLNNVILQTLTSALKL